MDSARRGMYRCGCIHKDRIESVLVCSVHGTSVTMVQGLAYNIHILYSMNYKLQRLLSHMEDIAKFFLFPRSMFGFADSALEGISTGT